MIPLRRRVGQPSCVTVLKKLNDKKKDRPQQRKPRHEARK